MTIQQVEDIPFLYRCRDAVHYSMFYGEMRVRYNNAIMHSLNMPDWLFSLSESQRRRHGADAGSKNLEYESSLNE
jgi:hypothetical protein